MSAKNGFGQMDNSSALNQMLNIVKCPDGRSDLIAASHVLTWMKRSDQTQAADRRIGQSLTE